MIEIIEAFENSCFFGRIRAGREGVDAPSTSLTETPETEARG